MSMNMIINERMEFTNIALIILLLIPICFLVLYHKKKQINNHVNLPPGNMGWPFIGETVDIFMAAIGGYAERFIFDRMSRYSPKVFKTSLLGQKVAVICDPSGKKIVFSSEKKLVRPWVPRSLVKIVMSDNLKITPDEELLRRRRLLSDFLKPDALRRSIQMMDHMTRQHMNSGSWAPSSDIKICPLVKKLTFSLGCHLFMGMDYNSIAHIDRLQDQFETVLTGMLTFPVDLPGTPFRRALKAANFIRREFQNIIRTKTLQTDSGNFVSHLHSTTDDEGKLMSESEIANMLMGMHIAHHTTSSLFANLVYYLADHPHIYELAVKEQLEIKSLNGGENLLTWEDTKRMKYARNVVHEVLRLSPPIGGSFREVMHDMSFQGFTIPMGWKIYSSFYSTHRNPEYFSNPDKFDPTRFEGNGPVPYSFTPFGVGPRMCPGYEYAQQSALVFMHNLLINFKWEKLIGNEKINRTPFSYPANGLPVKLQRRHDDAASTQASNCNTPKHVLTL